MKSKVYHFMKKNNQTSIKYIICLLILSLFLQNVQAQYQKLAPAQKTGAQMPANSGGASFSLPMFNYTAGGLSVPIGLQYASHGVMVDEQSSRAGHDWSLMAGGAITREIRGIADPLTDWDTHYPQNFDPDSQEGEFYILWSDKTYDREPDLFSFSFPGYSGSFVIGEGMQAIMMPYQPLAIVIAENLSVFTITTPQGVTYTFGGGFATETSAHFTTGGSSNLDQTAWHLVKMENLYGDHIDFEYTNKYEETQSGSTHQLSVRYWDGTEMSGTFNNSFQEVFSEYNRSYLTKISAINYGELSFVYREQNSIEVLDQVSYTTASGETTDTYMPNYLSSKERIFLTEVVQTSGDGATKSRHQFEYIDIGGLPNRLSLAQDHWGLYNGMTQNDVIGACLVPKPSPADALAEDPFEDYDAFRADRTPDFEMAKKGLLSKVTFPSGAITDYEYEANYQIEVDLSLLVAPPPNYSMSSCAPTDVDTKSFAASLDQLVRLNIFFSTDIADANISVYNLTTSTYVDGLENRIVSESKTLSFFANEGEQYEISIHSTDQSHCVSVDPFINMGNAGSGRILVQAGGARLSRVTQYDQLSGQSHISKYYYGRKEDPQVNSGTRNVKTDYNSYYRKDGSSSPNDFFHTLYSNSLNLQYAMNNGLVQYEYITLSYGGDDFENGGVEYRYNIDFYDPPEDVYCTSYPTDPCNSIKNSPWTMNNWNNGRLRSSEVFKFRNNELVVLKKSDYQYALDPILHGKLYGHAIYRKGGYTGPGNTFLSRYSYESQWSYLQSVESISYDENGVNPLSTIIDYGYDGANHPFLTSSSTTDSRGQVNSQKYKYPQDYSYSAGSSLDQMVQMKVLSVPIETISYLDGSPIGASATGYEIISGMPIPKYSFVTENTGQSIVESTNGTAFPTPYHQESEVLEVNAKGQVLSFVSSDDIVTNLVRGQNDKYVLAKVVNVTHQQITDILGSLTHESEVALSPAMESALRSLPNALVESYTFREGYGLVSKTDLNGRSQFYQYDSKGQLKYIKDHDGNVLSEQSINIKN